MRKFSIVRTSSWALGVIAMPEFGFTTYVVGPVAITRFA